VDQGEYGGSPADSQGQRKHRRNRKDWGQAELAQSVAHVAKQVRHGSLSIVRRFARSLFAGPPAGRSAAGKGRSGSLPREGKRRLTTKREGVAAFYRWLRYGGEAVGDSI
jgi:hypothetical protein